MGGARWTLGTLLWPSCGNRCRADGQIRGLFWSHRTIVCLVLGSWCQEKLLSVYLPESRNGKRSVDIYLSGCPGCYSGSRHSTIWLVWTVFFGSGNQFLLGWIHPVGSHLEWTKKCPRVFYRWYHCFSKRIWLCCQSESYTLLWQSLRKWSSWCIY